MRPDHSHLHHCFKEGVTAREAGRTHADNPYPPTSPEGREWLAGLTATPDLDEEDDPLSNLLRKDDD